MNAPSAHGMRDNRFGAGLDEAEVRRLQVILREQCDREVDLPEAWSYAIELLSLVEMLLATGESLPPQPRRPQGSRSLALDRFVSLRNG